MKWAALRLPVCCEKKKKIQCAVKKMAFFPRDKSEDVVGYEVLSLYGFSRLPDAIVIKLLSGNINNFSMHVEDPKKLF